MFREYILDLFFSSVKPRLRDNKYGKTYTNTMNCFPRCLRGVQEYIIFQTLSTMDVQIEAASYDQQFSTSTPRGTSTMASPRRPGTSIHFRCDVTLFLERESALVMLAVKMI